MLNLEEVKNIIISEKKLQTQTVVSAAKYTPFRLLQFRPAWELHACLRFNNVIYETENTRFSYALGKPLPL